MTTTAPATAKDILHWLKQAGGMLSRSRIEKANSYWTPSQVQEGLTWLLETRQIEMLLGATTNPFYARTDWLEKLR